MNNKELLKGIESINRKGYKLYLRSESIKNIFLSDKSDKSYTGFMKSKWNLVDTYSSYSSYLSNQIDLSIRYSEYLSENCYISSYTINDETDIYSIVNYENL